jgi:hypothetical protein
MRQATINIINGNKDLYTLGPPGDYQLDWPPLSRQAPRRFKHGQLDRFRRAARK